MSEKLAKMLIAAIMVIMMAVWLLLVYANLNKAHAQAPGSPLHTLAVQGGKRNRAVDAYMVKSCHLLDDAATRRYCISLTLKSLEACESLTEIFLRRNCIADVKILRGE